MARKHWGVDNVFAKPKSHVYLCDANSSRHLGFENGLHEDRSVEISWEK